MTYDVSGWIEVVWDYSLESEVQTWEGVIDLNRFAFYGDMVANQLFGLGKFPREDAYFADRGIPHDCCNYVKELEKESDAIAAKYLGGGWLTPTYAFWSEIQVVLPELKQEPYLKENWDKHCDWQTVFKMTEELTRTQFKPEWVRFVVWGIW